MEGVRYTPREDCSLKEAVREGRVVKVREIISSRSLYYSQEWSDASDGYALLCIAVQEKHTEIAKLLLTNGSRVNSENENPSDTPLHFAVENDDIEIIQMLLEKDANINALNISGHTPFHLALISKKIEIIHILLNQDARVEPTSKDSIIPMHIAIDIGSEEIINLLLSKGANVNAVCNTSGRNKGYTPLHIACSNSSEKIVKLLLTRGANVNAETKDGITSLHVAVDDGCAKIAEQLLKYGANVNAVCSSKNKEGFTPLHFAAESGDLEVIELLLKFGANVNSTGECGLTALHIACKNGHEEIVTVLLEHGFDTNIMRKENYMGLDLAETCDFVKILKRHMVKIKAANLYAVNKDILSIPSPAFRSDDKELSDFQNKCEKEIASMKSEIINDKISFYDILTRSVRQVAIYAINESIVEAFRSDNYKIKFPIYAGMINTNFRKGQKEKELMEKGDKIFGFLFNNNFPLLPRECTEKILSYLNYEDLI